MSAERQYVEEESAVQYQPAIRTHRTFRSCARQKVPVLHTVATVLCIAATFAVVWFLATQDARIDSLNYNIDQLQTQVQQTSVSNASLSAQVDKLTEPSRILSIALGQLQMQFALPLRIPEATGQTHTNHK